MKFLRASSKLSNEEGKNITTHWSENGPVGVRILLISTISRCRLCQLCVWRSSSRVTARSISNEEQGHPPTSQLVLTRDRSSRSDFQIYSVLKSEFSLQRWRLYFCQVMSLFALSGCYHVRQHHPITFIYQLIYFILFLSGNISIFDIMFLVRWQHFSCHYFVRWHNYVMTWFKGQTKRRTQSSKMSEQKVIYLGNLNSCITLFKMSKSAD